MHTKVQSLCNIDCGPEKSLLVEVSHKTSKRFYENKGRRIYFFFGAAFFAGFLAAGFFAAGFLAAGFLAAGFLAAGLAAFFGDLAFFAAGFLAFLGVFTFFTFFAFGFFGFFTFFFLGFLTLGLSSLPSLKLALTWTRVFFSTPFLRA